MEQDNADSLLDLTLALSTIVYNSKVSIQDRAVDISIIRKKLDKIVSPEENMRITSMIKSKVQIEAFNTIENGESGVIVAATGAGKTKIPVDYIKRILDASEDKSDRILIVVPTEKLRDVMWRDEFKKWDNPYFDNIEIICYASLANYGFLGPYRLVVLDECHNITENNSTFFDTNVCQQILGLTATYPRDIITRDLFKKYIGGVVYNIDTDTAVKLGIVNPYEIIIVNVPLNFSIKDCLVGSKDKPFYTTELKNYVYLTEQCMLTPSKNNYLKRMRFVYNLKSKTRVAEMLLTHVIPQEARTLIFCGSKVIADKLCNFRFYSKPSKPKKGCIGYDAKMALYEVSKREWQGDVSLNMFVAGKINRLACVEALNEGHNIENIDYAVIVQLNSNEKDLIQRIGRCIRYKPNHTGKIIIMCSNDTVDAEWVASATANLKMNITTTDMAFMMANKDSLNNLN